VIGDNLPNLAVGGITAVGALVTLNGANQIAAASTVTVNAEGRLNRNGNNLNISALTISGGDVQGAGTLTLKQDATLTGFVDAAGVLHTATIAGGTVALNVAPAGAGRTVTVNPTPGTTADHLDALISSILADGTPAANLVKVGTGVLSLTATNTYTGTTLISAGQVVISNANSLGSGTAAVTVAVGAGLRVGSGVTFAKPVNLVGPGYVSPFSGPTAALAADGTGASNGAQFNGAITLTNDGAGNASTVGLFAGDPGDSLRLTGVISGTGGLTALRGLVQETGAAANTYTGGTTVDAGATLELNRVNAGTPQLAAPGDLIVAGTVLVDAGVFAGVNAGSEIAPTSNVSLNGGTLTLAATAQQSVGVLRAHLTGTVNTAAAGSAFTFDGFTALLVGNAPGATYEQATFLEAPDLGGAALTLLLGFQPTVGDSFVLISNTSPDPVTGTFAGLAEGGTVTVNGTTFAVTYAGGDGNDVALSVLSVPANVPQGALVVSGPNNGTAVAFTPDAAGQYASTPGATFTPFGSIAANVRTASGDVNGDGVADTILVTGPGVQIRVAVISGSDNTTVLVAPFAPFAGSEDFTGGGFVAADDLDGDGKDEFVVTPDQGGRAAGKCLLVRRVRDRPGAQGELLRDRRPELPRRGAAGAGRREQRRHPGPGGGGRVPRRPAGGPVRRQHGVGHPDAPRRRLLRVRRDGRHQPAERGVRRARGRGRGRVRGRARRRRPGRRPPGADHQRPGADDRRGGGGPERPADELLRGRQRGRPGRGPAGGRRRRRGREGGRCRG
jgi:autotransporter-associated beta strand protein